MARKSRFEGYIFGGQAAGCISAAPVKQETSKKESVRSKLSDLKAKSTDRSHEKEEN